MTTATSTLSRALAYLGAKPLALVSTDGVIYYGDVPFEDVVKNPRSFGYGTMLYAFQADDAWFVADEDTILSIEPYANDFRVDTGEHPLKTDSIACFIDTEPGVVRIKAPWWSPEQRFAVKCAACGHVDQIGKLACSKCDTESGRRVTVGLTTGEEVLA